MALLVTASMPVPVHAANTDPRKAAELPPPDPSFVTLTPIDAPIVDGGRVDGILHVSLVVKANSAGTAAELGKRMPELRAAALPATIEFARLRASRFTPVDVSLLAESIAPSVKRVDGAGIDEVLIVKVSATEH